jgi:hypothetical protein
VIWDCEQAKDCHGSAGGPVCCGFGMPMMEAPSCTNYSYVSGAKGKGSVCSTGPCTGGFVICSSATDCMAADAGATCTPVRYHGNDLGFCQ